MKGNVPADAVQVKLYRDDASCTDPPAASGTKAQFEGAGFTVKVADDQITQLRARDADAAGNPSPCSALFNYTEDSTPPASPVITDIDPGSPTNYNFPRIRGSAAEGTVRIYASLDCSGPASSGSAASFTDSGIMAPVPDDSSTSFSATASDAAGNPSPCSADGVTFIEDSTAPETRIDSGPASPTNHPTPSFAFSSEAGASFECRLDGGSFLGLRLAAHHRAVAQRPPYIRGAGQRFGYQHRSQPRLTQLHGRCASLSNPR